MGKIGRMCFWLLLSHWTSVKIIILRAEVRKCSIRRRVAFQPQDLPSSFILKISKMLVNYTKCSIWQFNVRTLFLILWSLTKEKNYFFQLVSTLIKRLLMLLYLAEHSTQAVPWINRENHCMELMHGEWNQVLEIEAKFSRCREENPFK
jgi:hypothetical protein